MGDGGAIALPADHGDGGAHPPGAFGDDGAFERARRPRVGELGQDVSLSAIGSLARWPSPSLASSLCHARPCRRRR